MQFLVGLLVFFKVLLMVPKVWLAGVAFLLSRF